MMHFIRRTSIGRAGGGDDVRNHRSQVSNITFTLRVHAITEEDYECFSRWMDPERSSREACVPKTSGQQISSRSRKGAVDVPTQASKGKGVVWRLGCGHCLNGYGRKDALAHVVASIQQKLAIDSHVPGAREQSGVTSHSAHAPCC